MGVSWIEEARFLRASGRRLSEVAVAVGRDPATVWRAISDVPFVPPTRISSERDIRIPAWVRRADLIEDFRDVARSLGEHEAAAHCRRLTAAMRAPA